MTRLEELLKTPRYTPDGFPIPTGPENYGACLLEITEKYKPKSILEIGSHNGVSTEIFAITCESVITIDILLSEKLQDVLTRCPNITFYHEPSDSAHTKIPNESVDLLYIDGDHETESAVKDIRNYVPKVRPGGVIAGHDINSEKVRLAVDAELGTGYDVYNDFSWSMRKK
jgi:predicted O-methyltransferase YrrM